MIQPDPLDAGLETYQFAGGLMTVLADGAFTDGRYALLLAHVPPGNTTPAHLHDVDSETVTMLDGALTVETPGRSSVLSRGDTATLPPGQIHRLRNAGSETARYLLLCAPSGFETFVRLAGTRVDARGAVPRPMDDDDISLMVETAPAFGIQLTDGAALAQPVSAEVPRVPRDTFAALGTTIEILARFGDAPDGIVLIRATAMAERAASTVVRTVAASTGTRYFAGAPNDSRHGSLASASEPAVLAVTTAAALRLLRTDPVARAIGPDDEPLGRLQRVLTALHGSNGHDEADAAGPASEGPAPSPRRSDSGILDRHAAWQRRDLLATGVAALVSTAVPRTARALPRSPGVTEGFADVPGGRVWWRRLGSGSRTPLLLLHGGPGAGHDYLEPLAALAIDRPVIFYDQLGCGRSDKPDDPSLWRVGRFVEEIDALRQALTLPSVVLYGHSWGGWLAQEYMRSSADAGSVEKLVLASTSASVAEFTAGAQRLLAGLPDGMDARRRALEAAGATDDPDYAKIVETFYDRYLVHMDPPPAFLVRTFENLGTSRTYPVMNGPNEFSVTGTLKDWDASASLAEIRVPTLVLTSEWDEVTLDCHQRLHRGIRGSTLAVLPGARHLAMVEQPERYNAIVRTFLEAGT